MGSDILLSHVHCTIFNPPRHNYFDRFLTSIYGENIQNNFFGLYNMSIMLLLSVAIQLSNSTPQLPASV